MVIPPTTYCCSRCPTTQIQLGICPTFQNMALCKRAHIVAGIAIIPIGIIVRLTLYIFGREIETEPFQDITF